MKRSAGLFALAASLVVFGEGAAHAQGYGEGGSFVPGLYGPSRPEASPRTEDPKLSRRSVKIFDTSKSTPGFELHLGPLWYRPAFDGTDAYQRGTGEIILGAGLTTPYKHLYLGGFQYTHLRILDSKRVAWTIFGHEIATGAKLGIFELESRFGVGFLTVDAFRGNYSVEMLSPRVSAGAAIHPGSFRLDIQIHSEYLWRWFGEDYVFHGISLGFRLDAPRRRDVPEFMDPEKKQEGSPSKRP